MKLINAIRMGGTEILPLVEGGKGVAVSNGMTCGHWAAGGGVGTFSAVNADSYDADRQPRSRKSIMAAPAGTAMRS